MKEENVIFEAQTPYDDAANRALIQLMLRKLRRWPRLLVLSLGILMVVTGAALCFVQASFTLSAVLLVVLGDAAALFALFAEPFLVAMFRAQYKDAPVVNLYRFYDDRLSVSNAQLAREIPYAGFVRVLETGGYFFLFLNDRTAFILRKSTLRRGTPEALRDFLAKRVPV